MQVNKLSAARRNKIDEIKKQMENMKEKSVIANDREPFDDRDHFRGIIKTSKYSLNIHDFNIIESSYLARK